MQYRSTPPPPASYGVPTRGHGDARYERDDAYYPSPWAAPAYGAAPRQPSESARRTMLVVVGALFGVLLAIGFRAHQNAAEAAARAHAEHFQEALGTVAQQSAVFAAATGALDPTASSRAAAPTNASRVAAPKKKTTRAVAPARAAAPVAKASAPTTVAKPARRAAQSSAVATSKPAPKAKATASAKKKASAARSTRTVARPAPKAPPAAAKKTPRATPKPRFDDAERMLNAAKGATEHTL